MEKPPIDPMENWLMKPALEWLEQAEHGENNARCKMIAEIMRDLWRNQKEMPATLDRRGTGFKASPQGIRLTGPDSGHSKPPVPKPIP